MIDISQEQRIIDLCKQLDEAQLEINRQATLIERLRRERETCIHNCYNYMTENNKLLAQLHRLQDFW